MDARNRNFLNVVFSLLGLVLVVIIVMIGVYKIETPGEKKASEARIKIKNNFGKIFVFSVFEQGIIEWGYGEKKEINQILGQKFAWQVSNFENLSIYKIERFKKEKPLKKDKNISFVSLIKKEENTIIECTVLFEEIKKENIYLEKGARYIMSKDLINKGKVTIVTDSIVDYYKVLSESYIFFIN